ncbi:MAG: hypothetical protein RL660_3039 [Bacteroidota bacterium]|jgi:hypothetical protein
MRKLLFLLPMLAMFFMQCGKTEMYQDIQGEYVGYSTINSDPDCTHALEVRVTGANFTVTEAISKYDKFRHASLSGRTDSDVNMTYILYYDNNGAPQYATDRYYLFFDGVNLELVDDKGNNKVHRFVLKRK